jgi:hypothetical protein
VTEILSKLSSYNIFNYLFPGAVFGVIAQHFELLHVPNQLVEKTIWFYFIGLSISRIGLIVVEPILRKMGFISYSKYDQFVNASASDSKIDLLVEVANTYRTLCTLFIVILIGLAFNGLSTQIELSSYWRERILVIILFLLFLISFRKQSNYVRARVSQKERV